MDSTCVRRLVKPQGKKKKGARKNFRIFNYWGLELPNFQLLGVRTSEFSITGG